MGVDTYIFDEFSKECLYFDRNYNFFAFADVENDAVYDKVMYHMDCGRDHSIRFTAGEIGHCCDVNIEYWKKSAPDRINRVGWNEAIKKFVNERPSGLFFFRNDHQEPPSWDIRDGRTGGPIYQEIDGDEDEKLRRAVRLSDML